MAKLKIYSIHYNRPEFIVWQNDSFKSFLKCKDGFELVIVNNARDTGLRQSINNVCQEQNLQVIETTSDAPAHLPGKHHADSLNYVWKNNICKDDFAMFCDGDLFMVKDFNVDDFMEDNVLAGSYQHREKIYQYLTPIVIILKPAQMPDCQTIDWEGIGVNGVRLDTGGGLYNYFVNHPEVKHKTKRILNTWHIKAENNNLHVIPEELKDLYDDSYNIEFFGNEFLHYCRSSNWDSQTDQHHLNKSNFVNAFVYGCINKSIKATEHNCQIINDTYFGWLL